MRATIIIAAVLLLGGVGVAVLAVSDNLPALGEGPYVSPTPAPTPAPTIPVTRRVSCDTQSFIDQVVEMSDGEVLKIYGDARATVHTDERLTCQGTALRGTGRGREVMIAYYIFTDREGESFVGYELP